MGYAAYMEQLLRPLGIYTFREGSVSGGELRSIGGALDGCAEQLERAEREALIPTAEHEGLDRVEALFARRPAAPTLALRRQAIEALLQINQDCFTREAINRTLSGCGIRAEVQETDRKGCVRVVFPGTVGIPAEFDQIAAIVLDIIPCHLETEFYFRYLTWAELEMRFPTWISIEEGALTWEQLEQSV